MRRRAMLGGLFAVAGCGLAERPYEVRRDWPLVARRPEARPANPRGPVLLLRAMEAGPGLETRGLRSLRADASVHSDFYNTWAVPPAQGVEAALRAWLTDSGRYAAVLAPGSRMTPDFVLEATLTDLLADPPRGLARAGLSLIVLDNRGPGTRVRGQYVLSAEAALSGDAPAEIARALLVALGTLLGDVERALADLVRPA